MVNSLKIYNNLSRKKEEFIPQNPKEIKMYTCGVTVYDHCHIGHGRSLYSFEVMRRYFQYKGLKVKFVRNITDVDDKIINKAKIIAKEANIPLVEAFNQVRESYIGSYKEDLDLLQIPRADYEPLATEYIPAILKFIDQLIKKDYAYVIEGNVYFSLRKFTNYGKLSGKKIDDLFESVRIENDPLKRDPLDFALWKKKKDNEPFWDSEFGPGRPGWHIECSTMARDLLGDTLDIHGGGKDLSFPHHENEIAQSESLTGKPFARYWLHHGLITINGQKMAKSLGNFFLLKDALKQYGHEVLKLFYLSAHYSSALDFSLERLPEFIHQKQRLYVIYDRIKEVEILPITDIQILKIKEEFEAAMDDDFNFSLAKGALFALSSVVASLGKDDLLLGQVKNLFFTIGDIFCLFKDSQAFNQEMVSYIEDKINRRNQCRLTKKFSEADGIRKELLDKGIVLEDLKDGTTIWRIKR